MEIMDPLMRMMRTKTSIRTNVWGEEERITEEEEVKEEVAKEEIMATIIATTEATTDGGDTEKTARRYNLGKQKDPKNLLQAAKGA